METSVQNGRGRGRASVRGEKKGHGCGGIK